MIRKATVEDASDIAKITIDGWKKAYKNIVSDDFLNNLDYDKQYLKIRDRLLGLDQNFQATVIVYEENKKILGFAIYGLNRDNENYPLYSSELYAIYINPEYKFKGIGTKLISFLKKDLKAGGHKNMIVWCLQNNLLSIKFYEKNGGKFHETKMQIIGEENLEEVGLKFIL